MWRRRSKYNAVPTRSQFSDRVFQSRLEASREPALIALQNVGEITGLEYQTPFAIELFGTQAVEALLEALENGGSLDIDTLGLLLSDVRRSRQKVCTYQADFTYRDKFGAFVVEDTKGYQTPEYRLKKKLMVAAHNIEIQEPNVRGVQQKARGAGIRGRGTGSRLKGGR